MFLQSFLAHQLTTSHVSYKSLRKNPVALMPVDLWPVVPIDIGWLSATVFLSVQRVPIVLSTSIPFDTSSAIHFRSASLRSPDDAFRITFCLNVQYHAFSNTAPLGGLHTPTNMAYVKGLSGQLTNANHLPSSFIQH